MLRLALPIALALLIAGPLAAQPIPMGDAPVRVESDHVVATAIGIVPDGEASLAARRLAARTSARERATAMLHAWLDEVLRAGSISPRIVRDLHAAIDASADLRRIRSRADGSAVVELVVPAATLAAVHCPSGREVPWCSR